MFNFTEIHEPWKSLSNRTNQGIWWYLCILVSKIKHENNTNSGNERLPCVRSKKRKKEPTVTAFPRPEYTETASFVLDSGGGIRRGKTRNAAAIGATSRSGAICDGGLTTTREPRTGLRYSNDGYANVVAWSTNSWQEGERIRRIRRN